MPKFTFTEKKDTRSGFGVGLHELGKQNPAVVALCADLTGSLKMDAFKKEFPDRFFQGEYLQLPNISAEHPGESAVAARMRKAAAVLDEIGVCLGVRRA